MDDPVTTAPVCYRHPDRPTRLACSRCGRPICAECSHDAAVGQLCPECAAPTPGYRVIDARRTVVRPSRATAPVSMGIIALTTAVYLAQFLVPGANEWIVEHLSMANFLVAAGEWWRIFTAVLVHASIPHILFNMYALWIFGPRLERQVGSGPFALLYLASAGAGATMSYAFGPPHQVSVGASGAIFGLFGAWLFAAWKLRRTPAGRSMFNQLVVLLLINLALPLLIPGIDWRAHAGGLLGGAVVAWVWASWAVGRRDAERRRMLVAAAFVVAEVAVVTLLL